MIKNMALLVLAFVLTGCDLFESGVPYTLDNPTGKAITVSLDNKNYDLAATSNVKVELKSGIHTLSYDGETATFYLFKGSKGGLINPTLSNYYVNYVFYKTANDDYDGNKMAEQMLKSYENTETVLDRSITGHFVKYDSLLIEKLGDTYSWFFDVDQDYSDAVSSTSAIKVMGKIFREGDFAAAVFDVLPESYNSPEPRRRFSDLPLFYPSFTMLHECAQINAYFLDVNRRLIALQGIQTSDAEREEIKKGMQMHNIDFSNAKKECPKKDFYVETDVGGYKSRSLDNDAINAYEEPERKYNDGMKWIMERRLFLLK